MSMFKPQIIMISGWAMPAFVMEPLAAQFENYQICLLDLPGVHHNRCEVMPSIEAYAEHLLQHIPDQSICIGWSLGGLVAQYIAIHYPEKIKILIQIASSPYFLKSDQAEDPWPGLRSKQLTQLESNVRTNVTHAISDFIRLQFYGLKSKENIEWLHKLQQINWQEMIHCSDAVQHSLAVLRNTDLRNQLHDMKIPCLYILGRLDAIVPEKISVYLKAFNKNIEVAVLEHASHMPFLTHTTECSQRIHQYLNQVDSLL